MTPPRPGLAPRRGRPVSARMGPGERLMLVLTSQYGFATEVPFGGLSGRRRFRFDAAHEAAQVAVDYQGIGRGHQWANEQAIDHEKATEAQLCGWTFILCDAQSVNNGRCLEYVERALHTTPEGSAALADAWETGAE